MAKILVLEDNTRSSEVIARIIQDSFPGTAAEVALVDNVRDAKQLVQSTHFDVAIIDIQVPLRRGEAPKTDGGVLLLDHVLTSPHAKRPRYIVGVTAEKAVFEKAQPRFVESLFVLLQRDGSDSTWISQLSRFLSYVATFSVQRSDGHVEDVDRCSLAIVCALPDTELGAVIRWIEAGWQEVRLATDPNAYQVGELRTQSGSHRIIAVAAAEPGMATAASLATKTIVKFRPRVVAMVGIAAAIKPEFGFGDVVMAEQTWDYTTGKNTEAGIQPETRVIRCDPTIVDQVRTLAKNHQLLTSLQEAWPGARPNTRLTVRIGSMTSGGSVIEANRVIEEIRARDRKTIALDMEAHGVAAAGWYTTAPPTNVLIVKSVVDYGVEPKADTWHQYAAYTSAGFVREWALRYL